MDLKREIDRLIIRIIYNYLATLPSSAIKWKRNFTNCKRTAIELGIDNIIDMGKLMSAVRPKVVEKADEKLVSQIVK